MPNANKSRNQAIIIEFTTRIQEVMNSQQKYIIKIKMLYLIFD